VSFAGGGAAPLGRGGLGVPRLHLRRTDSTNERARALAMGGAPHGTLVTASEQSAGRGRQGRRWEAPAGSSVLMSLLVRWAEPEQAPGLLPLIAAVAVCDAVGEPALIKWPNDIVVPSAPGGPLDKLAGILVEGRPQQRWAVIGIGVNVAVRIEDLPDDLLAAARPATLGLGRDAVEPMVERIAAALAARLATPVDEILAAWGAKDALRGREIAWSAGHGRADGVDGLGRLVVALPGGGRTELEAGEVHLQLGG
jgi:BirA family biotin operon repressor/biotin-[acetyl-CoA-carboxylase] ligase